MSDFVLHAGLPKTGSTSLQEAVFPALERTALIDRPSTGLFADPPLPGGDAPSFFASVLARSAHVWDEIGEALWDDLVGQRRANRALLVSDEAVGRRASRPDLLMAHLLKLRGLALSRGFDRFRVIVLVRRQDHWLASHYAQVSDRRQAPSQADFEREVREVTSREASFYGFGTLLRYDVLHQALTRTVGADDVWLRPFEDMSRAPEAFWNDLGAFLGEPVSPPPGEGRLNARASGTDGWTLRPPRVTSAGSLMRRVLPMRTRSVSLTPGIERAVAAAFGPSNEALQSSTGFDLAARGYPMSLVAR